MPGDDEPVCDRSGADCDVFFCISGIMTLLYELRRIYFTTMYTFLREPRVPAAFERHMGEVHVAGEGAASQGFGAMGGRWARWRGCGIDVVLGAADGVPALGA